MVPPFQVGPHSLGAVPIGTDHGGATEKAFHVGAIVTTIEGPDYGSASTRTELE
jgi:hypothetical protein